MFVAVSLEERHQQAITTHVRRGQIVSIYNFDLSENLPNLVDVIFRPQNNSFRINLSYGYILQNRNTGERRYFHSSMNNAAFLDTPFFVRTEADFIQFMEQTTQDNVLEQAQRPNSEWIVSQVSNVTYYVFHIITHAIGFAPVTLPDHIKHNPGV